MTYAVPGAQLALQAPAPLAGHLRRFLIVLIALALAVTLVAIEAPAATQAHSSGRTDAQRVVAIAMGRIGARFQMGAEGPRRFDCSGLIYSVYKQAGLLKKVGGSRKLARGYYQWFKQRGLASRKNPKVGDLVVFSHGGRIDHSGIYIGNGRMVSALINPWGVKRTTVKGIRARLVAYLHVNIQR